MPWYRTEDGQGTYHALLCRSKHGVPSRCQAPRLAGDNPAHGETCGRSARKLCDGPRGPWSKLGSNTCDLPICERHAIHVDGQDLDYCPTHAHLATGDDRGGDEARSRETPSAAAGAVGGPEAPVVRHGWVKLKIHVYICEKCGTGQVNAFRGGRWVKTFHRPDGTHVEFAHVPPCVPGPFTAKYLAAYADVITRAREMKRA
jgi:hypothetical protein